VGVELLNLRAKRVREDAVRLRQPYSAVEGT
jgi:hypothetical protein